MSRSSKRLSNSVRSSALVLAVAALAGSPFALAGEVVPPPVDPLAAHHLATAPLPAQVSPGNILTPGAVPPPPPPMASPTDPTSASASASAASGTVPPLNAGPVAAAGKSASPSAPTVPVPTAARPKWHPPFQQLPSRTRTKTQVRHQMQRAEHTQRLPSDTLQLSNTQLNILRFSQPIRHLWFPASTPLVGKPAYFAQNHAVMLQFQPGVDQTVQVMVELADGAVISREAALRKGPGAVLTLASDAGTLFQGKSAPNVEPSAPDTTGMAAVRLLQSVVQGRIPSGFTAMPLPAATPFVQFTAQPVAFWQNDSEGLRIFVFQLQGKANPAITVTPPEFYRPGVESVLLTSDTVGLHASPFLYIVEAYHGE